MPRSVVLPNTCLLAAAALCTVGCAATARPTGAEPHCPGGGETLQLAQGVELRITADASPGAREAAERLQAEYRSTYLNAR